MYLQTNQKTMTAKPEKYPQGKFREKPCKKCGTVFQPQAPSHHYCSSACANEGRTDAYLMRQYGIDYNEYNRMLNEQDHKCGICGDEGFTMAKHHELKLVVDHDHETGRVRGLLCHNCNRALGLLKDNTESLTKAINWISETP
jgi:hypothetical protein